LADKIQEDQDHTDIQTVQHNCRDEVLQCLLGESMVQVLKPMKMDTTGHLLVIQWAVHQIPMILIEGMDLHQDQADIHLLQLAFRDHKIRIMTRMVLRAEADTVVDHHHMVDHAEVHPHHDLA
jgi:hypothetical protein